MSWLAEVPLNESMAGSNNHELMSGCLSCYAVPLTATCPALFAFGGSLVLVPLRIVGFNSCSSYESAANAFYSFPCVPLSCYFGMTDRASGRFGSEGELHACDLQSDKVS